MHRLSNSITGVRIKTSLLDSAVFAVAKSDLQRIIFKNSCARAGVVGIHFDISVVLAYTGAAAECVKSS